MTSSAAPIPNREPTPFTELLQRQGGCNGTVKLTSGQG